MKYLQLFGMFKLSVSWRAHHNSKLPEEWKLKKATGKSIIFTCYNEDPANRFKFTPSCIDCHYPFPLKIYRPTLHLPLGMLLHSKR